MAAAPLRTVRSVAVPSGCKAEFGCCTRRKLNSSFCSPAQQSADQHPSTSQTARQAPHSSWTSHEPWEPVQPPPCASTTSRCTHPHNMISHLAQAGAPRPCSSPLAPQHARNQAYEAPKPNARFTAAVATRPPASTTRGLALAPATPLRNLEKPAGARMKCCVQMTLFLTAHSNHTDGHTGSSCVIERAGHAASALA